MLHKAIRQFLEDVEWGELDYLLIDLPPGTGDVTMTLAQLLPQSKFVIVTTPQDAAQKVARRAAETAVRYDIELLGVVENMYGDVFGEGGGQSLADDLDVPLLGKIPLLEALRLASDAGTPLVLQDPDSPAAQALFHAARGIIAATPGRIPLAAAVPLEIGISGTPLPMAQ
jgi:ATP-binding protein involved in chromosome partitioning